MWAEFDFGIGLWLVSNLRSGRSFSLLTGIFDEIKEGFICIENCSKLIWFFRINLIGQYNNMWAVLVLLSGFFSNK